MGMTFTAIKPKAKESIAGFSRLPELEKPYIMGFVERSGRQIPRIHTRLAASDRLGWIRARWGVGRMNYKVLPGLYAAGDPVDGSPVLVTANYKMSFDALRKELSGIDAWILVLDTKGINVWCAAGKGTFGTAELVDRVTRVRLREVAGASVLVLPQLGAPGVSAPEVRKATRFKVVYGPVRAADLRAFLAAGMKKDASMSRVEFTLRDRLAVAPMEIVQAWPLALASIAAAALLALPFSAGYWARFAADIAIFTGSVFAGTFVFPAFLPMLPTRFFSVKGAVLGLAWGAGLAWLFGFGPLYAAGSALVAGAVVAFLGLNFTGSTTYTSPTGAAREVEKSLVPTVTALAAGLLAVFASRFLGAAWGIS